jgi:quercetin dioxygenase-like cupin family protein
VLDSPTVAASPRDAREISIKDTRIAGVTIQGEASVRPMLQTEGMQVMYLELRKGYLHPLHLHKENESTGIVISGLLEMQIGESVHRLGPNDTWFHPRGVLHETRAIEDTVAFEIHSPHRADYERFFA